MSEIRIAWAYSQDTPTHRSKALLGMFAFFADSNHEVRMGIDDICDWLSMGHNNVKRALKELLSAGLIADTGRFHGRTNRIPVYKLAYT